MDEAIQLSKVPEFRDLIESFHRMNNDREQAAAKRDPISNKMSRLFPAGVSAAYRYYPAGKNGKGQRILYCWSSHRNVAGFFLGWREVYMKNGNVKRDRWLSRRVKGRCKEIAARRAGVDISE